MRQPLVLSVAGLLLIAQACREGDSPQEPQPCPQNSIDAYIQCIPAVVTKSSPDTTYASGAVTRNWAGRGGTGQDVIKDGSTDSTIVNGTRWVCKQHERNYADVNDDFPLLAENADVIWPGAAVQGASLYRATPDPITAPRGPGDLLWTQINGSPLSSVHLRETTHTAVKHAADSLINAQPTEVPANVEWFLKKVRTREELQIAVEASASWFGLWGGSSTFDLDEDISYNYFLVYCKQNMFTLKFQRPSLPHQFFADGVDLAQIAPHVGPDNPPAYVVLVTYGRQFYCLVRSTESSEEMRTTLNANFNLGALGGSVGGRVDYMTQLSNLEFQWYQYGGAVDEFPAAVGGGLDNLNSWKSRLEAGTNYRLALPVFSTIRSVATDELVQNGYSIGYTYRDCKPFALCAPTPLAPQPGSVLDNGCASSPNDVSWTFSWTACAGASAYQLIVEQPDLGEVINEPAITSTSYSRTFTTVFTSLNGWAWTVRANLGDGWGPWSTPAAFTLEPRGTDCDPRVVFWSGLNYTGDFRVFRCDFNDLDRNDTNFADVTKSVQIFDLDGVRLYDHKCWGVGGPSITLTSSVPDLRAYNFYNRTGSVDIIPYLPANRPSGCGPPGCICCSP